MRDSQTIIGILVKIAKLGRLDSPTFPSKSEVSKLFVIVRFSDNCVEVNTQPAMDEYSISTV